MDSNTNLMRYTGRFAPSPTGSMHLGSLVAALASWLDARAFGLLHGTQQQRWLVRIEDTDQHRCQKGADLEILRQLNALGLQPDEPPRYQSQHSSDYAKALRALQEKGMAYACQCSRKDIETAWLQLHGSRPRFATLPYPGTCRHKQTVSPIRAWRFRTDLNQPSSTTYWQDRRLGPQQQNVEHEVGDFALLRGDGMWSYQLACVTDDALQGITHIVRGEDLLDNTARQILLQRALGVAQPRYLHIPLALDAQGEKLSKSNGAASIDVSQPLPTLQKAAAILGLQQASAAKTPSQALHFWTQQWTELHGRSAIA